MSISIGISGTTYPELRNIIGKVSNAEYSLYRDQYRLLRGAKHRLARLCRTGPLPDDKIRFKFHELPFRKPHVFHLFNQVSFGRTPWITTFETVLPRFSLTSKCKEGLEPGFCWAASDSAVQKAVEAMSASSCRRLLALSRCNYEMQCDLAAQFPKLEQNLVSKMEVLHHHK